MENQKWDVGTMQIDNGLKRWCMYYITKKGKIVYDESTLAYTRKRSVEIFKEQMGKFYKDTIGFWHCGKVSLTIKPFNNE